MTEKNEKPEETSQDNPLFLTDMADDVFKSSLFKSESEEEEEEEEEKPEEEIIETIDPIAKIGDGGDGEEDLLKKEEEADDDDSDFFKIASERNADLDIDFKVDTTKDVPTQLLDFQDVLKEKALAKGKELGVQEFLDSNPQIKAIVEGASDETVQIVNALDYYTKLELNEDDIDTLEKVYKTSLLDKGLSEEDAEELVETAKDSDKLFEKATKSKENIVSNLQKQHDSAIEKDRKILEEEEGKLNTFVTEIKTTISKGFKEVTLTSKEAKEFEEYVLKPVPNDPYKRTQADIAYANAPNEVKLYIDYLIKNNFSVKKAPKIDVSGVIKDKTDANNRRPIAASNASNNKKEDVMSLTELKKYFKTGN
jgi:hypothetical protein